MATATKKARAATRADRGTGVVSITALPMESRTSPAPGIIPEPSLVHDEPVASPTKED